MGFITGVWIIIQWLLMAAIFPIQIIFMIISLIQLTLALWLIRKYKLPGPFSAYQHSAISIEIVLAEIFMILAV